MKKLLLSTVIVGSLFAANTNTDAKIQQEINALKAKITKLENQVKENQQIALSNMRKVNPIAANNHLYWSYDLRTAFNYIDYKLANGKHKTNNVFSNRVILSAFAKPSPNLLGRLKLEANSVFGMNGDTNQYSQSMNNMNWVANETPDDLNLRLKQAIFAYFMDNGNLMFSAGRRPSTEGFPANLRDGDSPNSPIAHLVNMEFDGFSFSVFNGEFAKLSSNFLNWGTWLKFCAGRGLSPNTGKFSPYPYAKGKHHFMDFGGFIFVPYDNGQYALWTENIWADHVIGYTSTPYNNGNITNKAFDLESLGSYYGFNAIFKADGIGDGSNNFLANTTAFVSFAFSKTSPYNGKQMQGRYKNAEGNSIWIGADMPANESGTDRFGFNFVHGSKYFRPMDYGEDTIIGSIAATRGNAYEVYYIKQLIPHLTASLRATYIRYYYTGSNGFGGITSTPIKVYDVKKAENTLGYIPIKNAIDIRAYIRYKF